MPKSSNPMPPKGGQREYDVEEITGLSPRPASEGDESARTSTPVPAPAVTGPLGTGSDRANVVPNTEPTNDTPGAGLDTDRPSYTGSEDPPPEAQGLDLDELRNPLTIGGQLVQDAPFTAEPHVPPGTVPAPGKEYVNAPQADGTLKDPYPVPVEAGSRHVAYASGELPDSESQERQPDSTEGAGPRSDS